MHIAPHNGIREGHISLQWKMSPILLGKGNDVSCGLILAANAPQHLWVEARDKVPGQPFVLTS